MAKLSDEERERFKHADTREGQSRHYFKERKVNYYDALDGISKNLDAMTAEKNPIPRNINLAMYYLVETVRRLSDDVALLHNRLENLEREAGVARPGRNR